MKLHSAILIALSSVLLLNIPNSSTYETREILPSTGFWNYLPVFGIWARLVHYLAVDSDGLGEQVKMLDKYFKHKYTADKYVKLVNDIVTKAPKVLIAFRVMKIKDNLRNVRDPITKRTLGEAFDIIHDIGSDDDTVNEIASRLNLISPDDISMGGSATNADFDLKTTLKNTILENPKVIGDVMKDPQVINFITSSVLQYLAGDQVVHGIESMQELITLLEIAHPKMFEEGQNSLADLRDEKSGMTLIKTLETLMNIIENPEFPQELAKYLNEETLNSLHLKTQDAVSKVIEKKSKNKANQQPVAPSNTDASIEPGQKDEESQQPEASSIEPSQPEEESQQPDAHTNVERSIAQSDEEFLKDAANQGSKLTAKDFVDILKMLNIELSQQTAESILQSSQKNELGAKADQFLTELSKIEDLTPQKVAEFVSEKGVKVGETSVEDAINTIVSLPAEMLTSTLRSMGLNMPKNEVAKMKDTVEKLKKKYDKSHPHLTANRVQNLNTNEENLIKPPRGLLGENELETEKETSEMI